MNHNNYSLRVQPNCADLLLTHSISGICITVKMLYYEETQLEVWASALQEVTKNIMGTNLFLLSPLLKEHQHTMMEELGNNDYLLPILFYICKGLAPLEIMHVLYSLFYWQEKYLQFLRIPWSRTATSYAFSVPSNRSRLESLQNLSGGRGSLNIN